MGVKVEDVAEAFDRDGARLAEQVSWRSVGYHFPINIGGRNMAATLVESKGLSDDWTQRIWITVQIGEQYFRRYGVYRSHIGTDWEYMPTEEVFPQVKVIEGFFPA